MEGGSGAHDMRNTDIDDLPEVRVLRMEEARRKVEASPTAADQAPTPHAPRAHDDRRVSSSLETDTIMYTFIYTQL